MGIGTYYKLVGQTKYIVRSKGAHTIYPSTFIAVRSGDVLAFYTPGHDMIPYTRGRCGRKSGRGLYVRHPAVRRLLAGRTFRFSVMHSSGTPCRIYSLRIEMVPGERIYYGLTFGLK